MSRHTQISVADAEPHSTRRFPFTISRVELDSLVKAAYAGYRSLAPGSLAAAQRALNKIGAATASADLNKKQRSYGVLPKHRTRGRA